ncbi:MAG: hypothetical protein V1783_09025 [Bacteroidota bacterium]
MSVKSQHRAKRKAEKKRLRIKRWRIYLYNYLSISMYIGIVLFAYVLFYSLFFKPVFILKSYSSVDNNEFLFLALAGLIVGGSYFLRYMLKLNEEQPWQRNLRLLWDVSFNLDRYFSMKYMGVKRLQKRKRKHHSSSDSANQAQDK